MRKDGKQKKEDGVDKQGEKSNIQRYSVVSATSHYVLLSIPNHVSDPGVVHLPLTDRAPLRHSTSFGQ